MDKLSDRRIADIDRVAAQVDEGDLYKALHFVGDDPIKSEIEDTLKLALPDAVFKRVVAIFRLWTADDSPWLTEECED